IHTHTHTHTHFFCNQIALSLSFHLSPLLSLSLSFHLSPLLSLSPSLSPGSSQTVSNKHVLIMDEIDGMAGNEDRGGIQEMIGLIKQSRIPIICMCNDL
uniref:Uncharacterized protein n=1 Tax=Hucho hucho TaxID=62062 RepID=A0A4W5LNF6_9TELE